jgi:hypothetical protein
MQIRSLNTRTSFSFKTSIDFDYFWEHNTAQSSYLLKTRVNLTIIQTIQITFLTSYPRKKSIIKNFQQ